MNEELKGFAADTQWIRWSIVMISAMTTYTQSFVPLGEPAVFCLSPPLQQQHCLACFWVTRMIKEFISLTSNHLHTTFILYLIHPMKDPSSKHCPPHCGRVVGSIPRAWRDLFVGRLHVLLVSVRDLFSYYDFHLLSKVLWVLEAMWCLSFYAAQ